MTSINRSRHNKMDPWQEFDLIGGTSTGGLLAIMLGRLRMSVHDCEKAYSDLAGSLFTPRHGRSDVVSRAVDFLKANGRFDETRLEENVKARIADAGLDENELLEDERRGTCKVFVDLFSIYKVILMDYSFVCATQVHDNSPTLLRSYENHTSFGEIAGVKVWEAARATSAATTFFDPVEIGDHKELFADGALHYNNPMEMILQEAKELWPNDELLLLSIGTGTAPGQSINEGLLSVVEQLKRIATETEQTAQRFLRVHSDLVSANQLFRFNVYHGLGTIGLDESKELAQIAARTRTYLREPEVSWKMLLCANSFLVASYSKDLNKGVNLEPL
jgi:predicted acylesterase/phospholipase RssA